MLNNGASNPIATLEQQISTLTDVVRSLASKLAECEQNEDELETRLKNVEATANTCNAKLDGFIYSLRQGGSK
jgi:chromosome segregation ATPase